MLSSVQGAAADVTAALTSASFGRGWLLGLAARGRRAFGF